MRARFSLVTQEQALARQQNRCGSCGTHISALGMKGQVAHEYGEPAHAHHMRHVKFGGTNSVENCVILCWSCHYSAHEGGNYRHGTVIAGADDFEYFNG